jgi:hypothetical protein
MNDAFIFVFGLIATILAVGPLAYVAYLDFTDKEK